MLLLIKPLQILKMLQLFKFVKLPLFIKIIFPNRIYNVYLEKRIKN
jgi:hypothetical protein